MASPEQQVNQLNPENERPLTARELMQLPTEERQWRVKAALESAANEDFETFEAYSEATAPGD